MDGQPSAGSNPLLTKTDEVNCTTSNPIGRSPPGDDLPKLLARTIIQGSQVTSMDFHPIQQAILLVGTNVGEIGIWDVAPRKRLAHRALRVWNTLVFSLSTQDPKVVANRTVWSPDGALLGVAFSKQIVHYMLTMVELICESILRLMLILEVSMISPSLSAILVSSASVVVMTRPSSCLWNAVTGCGVYTFKGHDAPVYSICPRDKENKQCIFSAALDGKIKSWLYDAPRHCCTTKVCNPDVGPPEVDYDAFSHCYRTTHGADGGSPMVKS